MAGEFGDLLNLDFSGGSSGGFSFGGDTNLDVGTTMPASTPAADTGGFNFGDFTKNLTGGVKEGLTPFADLAKAVSPIVGLGTAGMGLASGIQGAKTSAANAKTQREALGLQRQIASQQQAAAQPLTQFGTEEINRANAGTIPPAIQAEIDQWKMGALQKARDAAARMGQGESTMLRHWEDWIEQQAQGMQAQYLQQEKQMGVNALGQGSQALAGAGAQAGSVQQNAGAEVNAIGNLMEQANKALASLEGAAG